MYGLLLRDGEFKLLLQRKHNALLVSPCKWVCVPTVYVAADVSASTVRSRVPHRHVSQCFISLARSSSCKYLAIIDGDIIPRSWGAAAAATATTVAAAVGAMVVVVVVVSMLPLSVVAPPPETADGVAAVSSSECAPSRTKAKKKC